MYIAETILIIVHSLLLASILFIIIVAGIELSKCYYRKKKSKQLNDGREDDCNHEEY